MRFQHCLLLTIALLGSSIGTPLSHAEEPKKLLVVTVTTGFRHSSIETAEKVLAELAEKSGAFTVDFVQQPEGQPKRVGRPPQHKPEDPKDLIEKRNKAYSEALALYNQAQSKWMGEVAGYMAEKMSLEKLKAYDGFIFANTTGDLQLPDREGFIDLIEEGRGFVAMHSGSDTYHPFRRYVDMLGGEFQSHKQQVEVTPIRHDPQHPAVKPIPEGFKVFDEIYIMKSFNPATVHGLLGLDAHPNDGTGGYFPISWCKPFGEGRVFYTSLGHREDVWDPTWEAGERKNPPEIAEIYQHHILNGILWSIGLLEGEAELGNVKP